MKTSSLVRLFLVGALATLAVDCGSKPGSTTTAPKIRGLVPEPARLPFTCVTPSCDTTLSTQIHVIGDRRIAIKRIILQNDSNNEFTITPSQTPPFIVGSNDAAFGIDVEYVPHGAPAAAGVNVVVTYTDSSPVETEDRIPPGDLVIPLIRRLVGEPLLVVTPHNLSFGTVWQGQTKAMPVHVVNGGFGNVALQIGSIDAGDPSVTAVVPTTALVADAGLDLPITFAPTTQMYLYSSVYIAPSSPEVEGVTVSVEGTSMNKPHLAMDPAGDIDFGEVPHGQLRTMSPKLVNQGGRDLVLSNVVLTDASGMVKVALPNNQTTLSLPPLSRVPMTITLDGGVPGPVAATLSIDTNEVGVGTVQLNITALVTEPKIQVTPTHIDYGVVPQGWVVTQPIELRNIGFGHLTVRNVIFVAGSSTLFTLRNLPATPFTLDQNARVAVDVEFRAQTTASFTGSVSIESDDSANSFVEVPLTASGGSCDAGCPIANGTPSCVTGSCTVGACSPGWFDVDGLASDGCECHQVGPTPGAFCQDAVNKGDFQDTNGRRDTVQGIVPTGDAVDLIRFHGIDGNDFFPPDSYDVQVRLDTADPNISMCVYRHANVGSQLSDCYYENESCGRFYDHSGSWFSSDDSDYVIKITRTAGSANTCVAYTVFIQNG